MNVHFAGRILCCIVLALMLVSGTASADPVSDYNVAVEFYKQHRWQPAADSCQEFLTKYPTHERAATARLYLAQALLHLKNYAESRKQFEQFLVNNPAHADRPLAMYRVGECSYFLGDDEAVESQFTQFLKAYPQHELAEWAMLYLGEAELRMKRYEQAVQTFEKSLATYPQGRLTDDVEFNLAGAYEALGKKEHAASQLQKIANRPQSARAAEALFQLAARSFDEQKYEQAAELFAAVSKNYPQHRLAANAQLNAGYAWYYLAKYPEAIKAFEQATGDPQIGPAAAYWIGLSYKSMKDYAQAATTLAALLKAHPESPLADKTTFHLADAEFRQGNLDQALTLFQQLLDKWPQSDLADDSVHSACEVALQAGKLPEAVALHERFVKNYPASPLRPVEDLLFARVLIAQGEKADTPDAAKKDYGQAEALLNEILKADGGERTRNFASFQLARLYERREENEKVLTALAPLMAAATADRPVDLDVRLLHANANLRLKNYDAAAQDYREYLNQAQSASDRIAGLAGLCRTLIAAQKWADLKTPIAELSQLDSQDSQFSRTAIAGANAAFDAQSWSDAQELFKLVLARGETGEHYLPAFSGLAHTEYELKLYADSASNFGKLIDAAASDTLLSSHAAYMHALSLQQSGDKKGALAAYQTAAQRFSQRKQATPLSPEQVSVALNAYRCEKGAARVAREEGNRAEADQRYQAAYDELKILPAADQRELDVLINEWANLAYSAEDYARADELYAKLIAECSQSPLVPEASLILGESARFNGDLEKAKAIFTSLADQSKAESFVRQRSLVHLLDLATEAKDWKTALELSTRLETEFPQGPHASYAGYRHGESLLQLKEYDKAAEVLHRLQASLPMDLNQAPVWWSEIWLMIAECHYWKKEHAQLDEVLADLRSRGPSPSVLYRTDALQGRSLENRARFAEARAAYAKVIDSEAGRGTETAADCQFRVAESFLKENNLPVALREYYKVYAGYAVPRLAAAALFQAASCDVSMKHYPDALVTYQKLLKEYPDSEFAGQAKARVQELQPLVPKTE